MNMAFWVIFLSVPSVSDFVSRYNTDFSVRFFRFTVTKFLRLLVGRGRYFMSRILSALIRMGLLNSSSPNSNIGAPCRYNQKLSNDYIRVGADPFLSTAKSKYAVKQSAL